MVESRPNPIRAPEEAAVPAAMAMILEQVVADGDGDYQADALVQQRLPVTVQAFGCGGHEVVSRHAGASRPCEGELLEGRGTGQIASI